MANLAGTQTDAASPCTLCGSSRCIVLAERVRSGEPLRTVLCTNCGLGRRDPMPGKEDLLAYYSDLYRVEMGKGRRPSKHRLWRLTEAALARACDVLQRAPAPCSSMDVGCGSGELVYLLASAGCDARGFDPDSNYIRWATGIMGPRVERRSIDEVKVEAGSLDLVTMYHVLEHMADPRAVLDQCAGWLKPGGLFVIEVPHFESTVHAPGHQYHKPHLFYFNRFTLSALAADCGLRLEEGGAFDHGENLRCYFRKDAHTQRVEKANPANVEMMLAILRGHRWVGHHLTAHPYRRVWHRLSRTLSESAHAWFVTDQQILERRAAELREELRRGTCAN